MKKEQVDLKKRKRGPDPMPVKDKREHRLNVFFSDAEYADLLSRVKKKSQLSSYVRRQAIGGKTQLSVVVPEINVQAYSELARVAGNLNQISRKLNSSDIIDLSLLLSELESFRKALVGSSPK